MNILTLINAHALAHVSRALEIAKVLRLHGHEIVFAGDGQYLDIATLDGFKKIDLPFVPVEQIRKAIRTQRLQDLFKLTQLSGYIEAELELYKTLNPDLLLIDNRLTAATSGEIAGIRQANIINVHISSYRGIPFYSLRNMLKSMPEWFLNGADKLEIKAEALLYDKMVVADMNKLRRHFNLPKKYGFSAEEGELILFPDIPQFSPVSRLSENTHFIGPLTWHNQLPAPSCLEKLDPSKKTIYFTIGSEGFDELLDEMDMFAGFDVQVIFAMGKKIKGSDISLPNNVFLEEFVNTDILFPHCDLVVCHGGNGTIYQALSFGLPIVGIATHEEQLFGLNRVNQLELGRGFSSKQIKSKGLSFFVKIILDVLNDSRYRENAQAVQDILRGYSSAETGAALIEKFLSKPI